jgi:hypothetical protein
MQIRIKLQSSLKLKPYLKLLDHGISYTLVIKVDFVFCFYFVLQISVQRGKAKNDPRFIELAGRLPTLE